MQPLSSMPSALHLSYIALVCSGSMSSSCPETLACLCVEPTFVSSRCALLVYSTGCFIASHSAAFPLMS